MMLPNFKSHECRKARQQSHRRTHDGKENGPIVPPKRFGYPNADSESCCHNYSSKANHYASIDDEACAMIDVTLRRGASRCHLEESLFSNLILDCPQEQKEHKRRTGKANWCAMDL